MILHVNFVVLPISFVVLQMMLQRFFGMHMMLVTRAMAAAAKQKVVLSTVPTLIFKRGEVCASASPLWRICLLLFSRETKA